MIPGILLAAGRGKRFGSNKLLLEIDGTPLICHTLKNCLDSRLMEIVVVLGARRETIEAEIRRHFPVEGKVRIVVNEDADRGMMSSLKAGISSLGEGSPGAMVLLADMPLVTPGIIDRLVDAFDRDRGIVVPECAGELRHPRILPARIFPEFLSLGDTEKGAVVLDRHRESIVRVVAREPEIFIDIDSPEDFEIVSKRLKSRLE